MSTVTFSNGKTANFDGTPTPSDIDYVAKQMGIQPDAPAPASPSIGADIVNAGKSAIGQIGAAAGAGINEIGQGFSQANTTSANPINPLEAAGKIGAGAASVALSPLAPILNPTVGAATNAIADKVSDSPSLQSFALSPAGNMTSRVVGDVSNLDTIAGAVTGADDPAALASQAKDAVDAITPAAKVADAEPAAPSGLQKIAYNSRVGEMEKMLNLSKGQSASEAATGKSSPAFAVQLEQEGVKLPFGKDERGRLDTTDAQDNVKEVATRDNNTLQTLLQSEPGTVSVDDAEKSAIQSARRQYSGTDQNKAIAQIQTEAEAYRAQNQTQAVPGANGEMRLPLAAANIVKKSLWDRSKFPTFGSPTDQVNAGANYLLGSAFKDQIESNVGDGLVKELNKRLGDTANLQRVLERAQGGAIHGKFFAKKTAQLLGGMAGMSGGPVSAIVTGMGAGMIEDALNSPNLSWSRMILARAQHETPGILKKVEARIGKNANDALNRKLLGPGSTVTPPPPDTSGVVPGSAAPQPWPRLALPQGNMGTIPGPTLRLQARLPDEQGVPWTSPQQQNQL